MPSVQPQRCRWVDGGNALYYDYHDKEWGVPVRDDTRHFEFLILEGMQAGLSWAIVLNKRENYRRAFAGFNPQKVARFEQKKINTLLQDSGLIRNRLKMEAVVSNARVFLKIVAAFGSFDNYVWRFVDGKPMMGKGEFPQPTTSPEAKALALDLKARGFKFVGETIIYAHMQAAGMINDHDKGCFRRRECVPL